VPEILSILARDAIALFGGPAAGRIRACAGCGLPRVAGGWCCGPLSALPLRRVPRRRAVRLTGAGRG
jgi:hypothetical protein